MGEQPGRRGPGLGDLWGGLASMLVAFPSSVAFGVVILGAVSPALSGMGALAGLVGAATLGIVAPLVGRNPGFVTAPCAPAAAVMSGLALHLSATGLPAERVLGLLGITALASALLQVGYGALGVGRLMKFVPYQVVSGYLSGVAVIIALAQLPKALGVTGKVALPVALTTPSLWSGAALAIALSTIAATAVAMKYTKVVPGPIVGLSAGLLAYLAASLAWPELRTLEQNPLVIGPIAASGSFTEAVAERLGSLRSLAVSDLRLVAGPATTLSVLLSIDTLKTGVVLDALTHGRHRSNRELVAQGVANAASFVTGGVPGAGSMGPSLINVTSGCRSPWGGLVSGVLILLGFLLLRPAMAWVPLPSLAGILLVVAWRMFDFRMFRLALTRGARLDFAVIAAVVLVAATVGLIEASLTGVCLAIVLFIRDQIRETVIHRRLDLSTLRSARRRSEEENRLLDEHGRAALFVQLRGDLFFGTTDQLLTELEPDLATRRFVLLDFRRVDSMDYTGAHLLTQMQERLAERGGELLFTGMPSNLPSRQAIERYLRELGVVEADRGRVFETRDSALEWMEEQVLATAGWVHGESRPPLEIPEIAVFRPLSEPSRELLSRTITTRRVEAGQPVFGVGEGGDEMFFVRSGRIHIQLPLAGGKRHHLATISRGDFFGEMAFLDQRGRSATAEPVTPVELFVLSRKAFDAAAAQDPRLGNHLFEQLALAIAQRLRHADAERQALEER